MIVVNFPMLVDFCVGEQFSVNLFSCCTFILFPERCMLAQLPFPTDHTQQYHLSSYLPKNNHFLMLARLVFLFVCSDLF